MLGAIAGDIIGSRFERFNIKSEKFELFSPDSCFTDDTVMTVAIADSLLTGEDYAVSMRKWGQRYPNRGYGQRFALWLGNPNLSASDSSGNGAAMRVSPIGMFFNGFEDVLAEAERSALASHNHPEAVKGAQAIAASVYLAKNGDNKGEIRKFIIETFAYNLEQTIESMRPNYHLDFTCQGTVPQAIIAFLDSTGFEDTIRKAISLGGDSDTIACMAGAIAHAYYRKIPAFIVGEVRQRLTKELLEVVDNFSWKAFQSIDNRFQLS